MYRLWKKKDKWRWNLRADGNHCVMLKCPHGFENHVDSVQQIRSVYMWANKQYKPMLSIDYWEKLVDDQMKYGFMVRGLRDGEHAGPIIAVSKDYKGKAACLHGAKLATRLAKTKEILLVNYDKATTHT